MNEILLKDFSTGFLYGQMFILKNKQFGTHLMLCCKYPAKLWQDKHIFINLLFEDNCVYHYSSVDNDIVLKNYKSILELTQAIKDYNEIKLKEIIYKETE